MKNVLFILALFFFPLFVFAQDVPPDIPQWFLNALDFIAAIPGVGPILAIGVKYASYAAGILTFIASVLLSLQLLLQKFGTATNAKWMIQISEFIGKFLPIVQWFSMYNVQKDPPKK